ncbi:hypothetical protein AAOGI_06470 [Agarivorans albus]
MNAAPLHEITIPINSARVAQSIMNNARTGFYSCLDLAKSNHRIGLKSDSAKAINYAGEYRKIYAAAKAAHDLISKVA